MQPLKEACFCCTRREENIHACEALRTQWADVRKVVFCYASEYQYKMVHTVAPDGYHYDQCNSWDCRTLVFVFIYVEGIDSVEKRRLLETARRP